jgi:hypothetical protein
MIVAGEFGSVSVSHNPDSPEFIEGSGHKEPEAHLLILSPLCALGGKIFSNPIAIG